MGNYVHILPILIPGLILGQLTLTFLASEICNLFLVLPHLYWRYNLTACTLLLSYSLDVQLDESRLFCFPS